MNPQSNQQRISFGYDRDYVKIILHEGQAATVKLIYNYYLEGKSISSIKDSLENMGIPSPQNRKSWGKQTISNILSNPHYLGSDVYPAIITQEQFDLAQQIKHSKTK